MKNLSSSVNTNIVYHKLQSYFEEYVQDSNWMVLDDESRSFLKDYIQGQRQERKNLPKLAQTQAAVKNRPKISSILSEQLIQKEQIKSALSSHIVEKNPPIVAKKEIVQEKEILSEEDEEKKFLDQLSCSKNLDSLKLKVWYCQRCSLGVERRRLVFGQGNFKTKILFIGEAPGEEEDKMGVAFVGKAGQLLTQIIQSIGINRDSVYISNVIKCRPPGNRKPEVNEIQQCSPVLFKQIELIQPKLIVTLGNIATRTLLPKAGEITRIRGQQFEYKNIPLIPTFHPLDLIKKPEQFPLVWEDMKKVSCFI